MDVYLSWREASVTVQHADERWCGTTKAEHEIAHAACTAALDREKRAAVCFQHTLDRVAARGDRLTRGIAEQPTPLRYSDW